MNKFKSDKEILDLPIEQLPVSQGFKKAMALNNFHTLAEVLEVKVSNLMKLPDFNYHILVELTGLLEKYRLAKLLKQS